MPRNRIAPLKEFYGCRWIAGECSSIVRQPPVYVAEAASCTWVARPMVASGRSFLSRSTAFRRAMFFTFGGACGFSVPILGVKEDKFPWLKIPFGFFVT